MSGSAIRVLRTTVHFRESDIKGFLESLVASAESRVIGILARYKKPQTIRKHYQKCLRDVSVAVVKKLKKRERQVLIKYLRNAQPDLKTEELKRDIDAVVSRTNDLHAQACAYAMIEAAEFGDPHELKATVKTIDNDRRNSVIQLTVDENNSTELCARLSKAIHRSFVATINSVMARGS